MTVFKSSIRTNQFRIARALTLIWLSGEVGVVFVEDAVTDDDAEDDVEDEEADEDEEEEEELATN